MKSNHQSEKYSEIINQSNIILWFPENNCRAHLNKVYGNYNKLYYLQRNKKCYDLETTFQKKVNFSQVKFKGSYYLTIFQSMSLQV